LKTLQATVLYHHSVNNQRGTQYYESAYYNTKHPSPSVAKQFTSAFSCLCKTTAAERCHCATLIKNAQNIEKYKITKTEGGNVDNIVETVI